MQKVNKLNPSIDIIPLQGTSNDKLKMTGNKHKTDVSQPRSRDPLLISRVQKVRAYMYANEDKTYIDVNEMADELQKRYRDYRYKKRGAFRALVHEAYNELTEMFSKKAHECSIYDDDDEENEIDIESEPQSPMSHDMLLRGYRRPQDKQNGNSSDKELIDISSDDDAGKVEFPTDESKDKNMKKVEFLKEDFKEENAKRIKNNTAEVRSAVTDPLTSEMKQSIREEFGQTQSSNSEMQVSVTQSDTRKRTRRRDTSFIVGKRSRTILLSEPKYTFTDVCGCDNSLKKVCKLLAHIKHPEVFNKVGILISRGFIIHGPAGCGKTLLAHAIAGELAVPLLKITGQELGDGEPSETELRIRELFDQAITVAPCVLLLDDIDKALIETRTAKKINTQLLAFFDELRLTKNGDKIVVIAATRYPDSLDSDLKRTGYFDQDISLGIPNSDARKKILALHTKNIKLSNDVGLSTIASLTSGFIGGDLVNLIQEAAVAAINRVSEVRFLLRKYGNERNFRNENTTLEPSTSTQTAVPTSNETTNDTGAESKMDVIRESSKSPDFLEWIAWIHDEPPLSPDRLSRFCIERYDFDAALEVIRPSAYREGFITVPDVTWDDIGSHRDIREELRMAILNPIRHSEYCRALNLSAPTGIMLCGPPGCGKTLLAKAIAHESEINFISVKGSELLNRYTENGKAISQCFNRAKNSTPCIMFFEELEVLCPKKSENDNCRSRITSQMITEMDRIKGQGVILMAASNQPDMIDPTVFRSGRLDKIIYVGLPSAVDRVDILRVLTKGGSNPHLADDVSLEGIAYNNKCEGYTGADLAVLIRESKYEALKEIVSGYTNEVEICMRHFVFAFDKVQPLVRDKDIEYYEKLRKLYSTKKTFDKNSMEMPLDPPISDTGMEPMET